VPQNEHEKKEKKQEIKNQGMEKGLQMKRKHVKCVKIHWHKMCKIDTVANLGSTKWTHSHQNEIKMSSSFAGMAQFAQFTSMTFAACKI